MIHNEDGLTMILSVFIIVTLLSLVYAFSIVVKTDNANLEFSTKTSKSFYGAEAGIETSLTYLNQGPTDLSEENYIKVQLDNVSYEVTITKDDIYKYKVVSQGQYKGVNKKIIAKLETIDQTGDGKKDGLIIASWQEY
jgi:hypothetical protein